VTENHGVGGSIPPLGTTLLLWFEATPLPGGYHLPCSLRL